MIRLLWRILMEIRLLILSSITSLRDLYEMNVNPGLVLFAQFSSGLGFLIQLQSPLEFKGDIVI
jgi:hypothetical protein